MLAIEFGMGTFNVPQSEQTVFMAVAAKSEYTDRMDFVKAALEKYTFGDPEWYEELISKILLQPAKKDDVEFCIYGAVERINKKVSLDLGDACDFEELFPVEWNDACFVFECGGMYCFYNRNTTA